jgi:ribosomal protein L19
MATPAEATSVRNEVVVNAPVERAFAVFTEQMDRIKPREHNMLGVDIAETVFE